MTVALLFAAILIGYVRRGKLSNLANLKIRLIPLMVLAFLLQGSIYAGYAYGVEQIQEFDILLHFVSYILLFAALMSNFDNKWFIVITLGVIMNFVVIFLNGGKMPVSLDAAEIIGISDSLEAMFLRRGGTHQPLVDGTLVWYLADILPLPLPGALAMFSNIYSVGDIFIYGGAMGLIQSAMKNDHATVSELDLEDLDEEMFNRPVPEEELLNGYFDEESDARSKKIQEKLERIEDDTLEQTMVLGNVDNTRKTEIPVEDKPQISVDVIEKEVQAKAETDDAKSVKQDIQEPESSSPEEYRLEDISPQDYKASEMLYASKLKDDVLYNQLQQDPESKYHTKPLHETRVIDLEPYPNLQADQQEAKEPVVNEEAPAEKPVEEVTEQTFKPDEPLDTVRQFIIVDGRIVENPNYNKRPGSVEEATKEVIDETIEESTQELTDETNLEEVSEEAAEEVLEGADVEEASKEEPVAISFEYSGPDEDSRKDIPDEEPIRDESGHILQRLSDSERVDLMKKMKERKERGYSLVQVKVGDKQINFWKKDL